MKYQIHCYNLFCFLLQPYYDILYSVNKHPSHLYFFIHYVYCLKIGINYICVYKLAKKCYIFKLYFSVLITTYTFLSFCCHFVILFGCCLFLFLFILYYIYHFEQRANHSPQILRNSWPHFDCCHLRSK